MDYFIIDASAPFFACAELPAGETINWSKAPFRALERDGTLRAELCDAIVAQFETYAGRVASLGYNTVTLDDVAHMVECDFYPPALRRKIAAYQSLYDRCIEIALRCGLKVLVTTDVMFFNQYIERQTGGRAVRALHLLSTCLRRLFVRFPHIHGVVMRIGEADGVDVRDDFHSRLILRTPGQCRRLIRDLLPLFEKHDRVMVVRTWTLGAYKIGDLIWNRRTYDAVFGGIYSRSLIVSHKFGDTDFYRYLTLNELLFEGSHRTVVELQARREYEGLGEFPSFIGFDYEDFARQLEQCRNIAGISVWCQTGGWARMRRLTFLSPSPWNEINAAVTIKIFRERMSARAAVEAYCRESMPGKDPEKLMKLLAYSDAIIKQLWYLPEYSSQRLYFRRVRIPPLIWIFWDTLVVNHFLRKTLRGLVRRRREAVREAYDALYKIRRMRALACELGFDCRDFDMQYDTFRLCALAREYFLGDYSRELQKRFTAAVAAYESAYPHGFKVEYDFAPTRIKREVIQFILAVCMRRRPSYRLIDRLFLVRLTGWLYPLIKIWERRRFPEFTQKQAMGIQVLFK